MTVTRLGKALKLAAVVLPILTSPALHPQPALGPEAVGLVLRLGAPGANGLRGYGMGNTMAASTDESYNPAMIVRDHPRVAFRHGWTLCDDPDDTSFSIWLAEGTVPLSARDALKVVYLEVDSGTEATSLVPIPGCSKRISGRHAALAYGRRMNERLSLGISGAALLDSDISLRSPLGTEIAHISGQAEYSGARLGAAYETSDEVTVAAQYDFFTVSGKLVNNLTSLRVYKDIRLRDLVAGVQWAPDTNWSVVGELEAGSVRAPGYRQSVDSLRFGVEYRHGDHLAFRAGLADGNPTVGIGYTNGKWSARFAWMSDQYEDELRPVFGHSDTLYLSIERSL